MNSSPLIGENMGMGKIGGPRLWELDFLRGLALVSMVGLHVFEDWLLIKGSRFLDPDFHYFWQRGTAILFLVLFGVAAYLSYIRDSQSRPGFQRWVQKGAILFGWGMVITFITKIFLKEGFVVFGILHLMGAGSVLIYPLLPFKYWNLILGTIVILAGNYLNKLRFTFEWLAWLGLIPEGFSSVDYFPITPWFGYILIGIFLGNVFYPQGNPRLKWKDFSNQPAVKGVCFLGRESLLIYLVHQPLLLAIIYLINFD